MIIKTEKTISDYLRPISINGTEKILNQMRKSVCKIHKEDGTKGTGFFCRIEYPNQNKYLYLLMTNNHILEEKDIKNDNNIIISLNNEDEFRNIKIDNSRKVYTSEKLDVTFIEIKPNFDKIEDFLDIDENIYKNENFLNDIYSKKSIYSLHYPKGKNIVVSYGLSLEIKDNAIYHLCYTEEGSSGSPLLSLNNFKVIGIHYGKMNFDYNKGTFIKKPLLEFLNNYSVKPKNTNINNKYNLNKINEVHLNYKIEKEKEKTIKIFGDDFVNNNKENCFLIIDNNQLEICSKIEIKDDLKNKDILEIILIEIKTINNMSHMFDECQSLLSLPDINKWNTSNIIDMSYMFFGCSSLNNISDISIWNTSKVENMKCMFCNCSSLTSLPDISKWDISNVKNINGMFYGCKLLSSLPDISKWNTLNITDMNNLFSYCSSLLNLPNISKWTINNASIYGIFIGCNPSLEIPSKFK